MQVEQGTHYSMASVGTLADLGNYHFRLPSASGKGFPGKVFLKEALSLTGMEVSLNLLPAGKEMPFSHRHQLHEELYIFLQGHGQFLIDEKLIEVAEGSMIRVAPAAARAWRNHSTEDLVYIVIQAMADSMPSQTVEDGVLCPEKPCWPTK